MKKRALNTKLALQTNNLTAMGECESSRDCRIFMKYALTIILNTHACGKHGARLNIRER